MPSGPYTLSQSDYQWQKVSGNFSFVNGTATDYFGQTVNIHIDGANPTNSPMQFRVRVHNDCGWGNWVDYTRNDGTTNSGNSNNNKHFSGSPNPAFATVSQVNINVTNTNLSVLAGTVLNTELYTIAVSING